MDIIDQSVLTYLKTLIGTIWQQNELICMEFIVDLMNLQFYLL